MRSSRAGHCGCGDIIQTPERRAPKLWCPDISAGWLWPRTACGWPPSNRSKCISGTGVQQRLRCLERLMTCRPRCAWEIVFRCQPTAQFTLGMPASNAPTGGRRSSWAATGRLFIGYGDRDTCVLSPPAGTGLRRRTRGWAFLTIWPGCGAARWKRLKLRITRQVQKSPASAPTVRGASGSGPRRTGCILCRND